jgi:hypothetical protein
LHLLKSQSYSTFTSYLSVTRPSVLSTPEPSQHQDLISLHQMESTLCSLPRFLPCQHTL